LPALGESKRAAALSIRQLEGADEKRMQKTYQRFRGTHPCGHAAAHEPTLMKLCNFTIGKKKFQSLFCLF